MKKAALFCLIIGLVTQAMEQRIIFLDQNGKTVLDESNNIIITRTLPIKFIEMLPAIKKIRVTCPNESIKLSVKPEDWDIFYKNLFQAFFAVGQLNWNQNPSYTSRSFDDLLKVATVALVCGQSIEPIYSFPKICTSQEPLYSAVNALAYQLHKDQKLMAKITHPELQTLVSTMENSYSKHLEQNNPKRNAFISFIKKHI